MKRRAKGPVEALGEAELRTSVAKKLGHEIGRPSMRTIPDEMWETARNREWIEEYYRDFREFRDEAAALSALVGRFRAVYEYEEQRRAKSRSTYNLRPREPGEATESVASSRLIHQTEDEKERGQALAKYLAKVALGDTKLKLIRLNLFGAIDRVLTPEQARTFIASPVVRFPPAIVVGPEPPSIPPSEITEFEAEEGFIEGFPYLYRVSILPEAHDGQEATPYQLTLSSHPALVKGDVKALKQFPSTGADGEPSIYYTDGSKFDDIVDAVDWLAPRFGWDEHDTLWYILTGDPPAVDSIVVRTYIQGNGYAHNWATITMTMHAWASPESVRRTFSMVQREMLGNNNKRYGYRSGLNKRKLALFNFVTDRLRLVFGQGEREDGANGSAAGAEVDEHQLALSARAEMLSTEELIERWNELHPQVAKPGRKRKGQEELGRIRPWNFEREFDSAWEDLVRPPYQHPREE